MDVLCVFVSLNGGVELQLRRTLRHRPKTNSQQVKKTPQVFKTTAWNKSWTEDEGLSRQRSEVRDRLWEFVSETEEI